MASCFCAHAIQGRFASTALNVRRNSPEISHAVRPSIHLRQPRSSHPILRASTGRRAKVMSGQQRMVCAAAQSSDAEFLQECEVGVQNVNLSTKKFKDFIVSTFVGADEEVKVTVDVSGSKTQEIFDAVFAKLVEAAQPIPGFRRVKGGKTPDIPKDVLLHIIGPSKVNKETILSVINTTVSEFVAKEGLDVSGDLRVEQSYNDIEAAFVPGKEFSFEAIIPRQRTGKS